MIITVTLSPEIERKIFLSDFCVGQDNNAIKSTKTFGGGGLSASRIIKALGGETTAIGFIAGKNGRFIKDSLEILQIERDFTEVPGQLRTITKIIKTYGD